MLIQFMTNLIRLVREIQYNTVLAITDEIRGIARERIYIEFGLEFLADREWYRKVTFFYKTVKNLALKYLQSYFLPQTLNQYLTRSTKKNLLTKLPSRILALTNMFFTSCINEWKKLNENLEM